MGNHRVPHRNHSVGNCKDFLVKKNYDRKAKSLYRIQEEERDLNALTFIGLDWCVPILS